MTASVLKQDANIKKFKRTLIYFNTDTQYAHFRGNPLYQATKRHLNNKPLKQQAPNKLQKLNQTKISLFLSVFIVFGRLSVA